MGHHHILEEDIQGLMEIDDNDIKVTAYNQTVQVPVVWDGKAYIAKTTLKVGKRPQFEWTFDKSNMMSDFNDDVFYAGPEDGDYNLDSTHNFKLTVHHASARRNDFQAPAKQYPQGRCFIMTDQNNSKTSTYIQITNTLIIEFSPSIKGKIFLWRKQQ